MSGEQPPNLSDIDLDASEAVSLAPSDPDKAAEALLIAAEYIRKGKPLPSGLDDYVADAIEYSMHKPKEHRNTAFLMELHLTAQNRRPVKARWVDAGARVAELMDFEDRTQNQAEKVVAAEYSISKSAAKRLHKEWLQISEELRKLEAEDRDS